MPNSIKTPADFGRALKAGAYSWPGGYPVHFVTEDGAAVCFTCAQTQAREITSAIRDCSTNGWRVVAQDINWEDPSFYCDHCATRIESAYAEDEAKALAAGRRQL